METPAPTVVPVVQLVITLTSDNQIQVNGPIENKMVCYGLLEIAKEVVQTHCANLERNRIVAPAPGVAQFLKKTGS